MNFEEEAETFRQPWESDEHWDIRKSFILQYFDKFDQDRLLSLSQIYVNVEILGCSYSADVMSQINELIEGLPPSKRVVRKEKISFVPESSNKKYKVVQNTDHEERKSYDHRSQNRQTAASFFSEQKS